MDCEDGSDEANCEAQCCDEFKVNSFEFVKSTARTGYNVYESNEGMIIRFLTYINTTLKINSWNPGQFWELRQMTNGGTKVIGFSKTKTTCPVSAGADWSIFSANQFSSMNLIECTARKMIIVLSAIPLRLRETGSDNAHFCLDNINKKPFNTYKYDEAKYALETFDEHCEVDVVIVLQKLISMLKKVPINHGGCKVYTFIDTCLNDMYIVQF